MVRSTLHYTDYVYRPHILGYGPMYEPWLLGWTEQPVGVEVDVQEVLLEWVPQLIHKLLPFPL